MNTTKTIFFEAVHVISVDGKDAIDFLNSLTLSDITQQAEDSICYNAICNPKGRMVYSFFIKKHQNSLLLATDSAMSAELLRFLNMRRFRAQVDIHETQQQLILLTDTTEISNNTFPMLDFRAPEQAYDAVSIFEWIIPTRFPWITAETTEKHIPQDLDLDTLGVISFSKGCYPGQEIVARLHYLGNSKKSLLILRYRADEPLANGTKITLEDGTNLSIASASIADESDWICQTVAPTGYQTGVVSL